MTEKSYRQKIKPTQSIANQTKPTQSIAKKSNPRTGSRPSLPSSTHCKTHGNPSKTNLIHPRQNCATHTVKPKDDFANPQSLQLMAEANKLCFAVKPSIKKKKILKQKKKFHFPQAV
jgi:hypothetical protein